MIVDLMDVVTVLDGPEGEEQKAPSLGAGPGRPTVTRSPPSTSPVRRSRTASSARPPSSRATGDKVKKGQTITVNYLGQVYDAKKPFDESYSGEPASFAIGVGQVVAGWDKTLVGATVGSRMILAIPPADGYGKKGNAAGRHQGHRHAVLRGRHPGRILIHREGSAA